MSDRTTASGHRNSLAVTIGLLIALVALFVIPMLVAPEPEGDAEAFGGTDAQATESIEEANPDYEPWFEPVFEPGSGEIESGLFALQAGIGGAVLGYVIGRLQGRRRHERTTDTTVSTTADSTQSATIKPSAED